MADRQINIWVIDPAQFDQFIMSGGKVIYIADGDHRYDNHPSVVSASALLPTIEGIEYELDGRLQEAMMLYDNYLQQPEADSYISVLLAGALKYSMIGIMFGPDESNMVFPKMLMDFLFTHYGMVLGIIGKIQPYMIEAFIPVVLAKLYNMNLIDYPTFMEIHPDLPIFDGVISKMAVEVNPLVRERTMEGYREYFNAFRKSVSENNHVYLPDPMVGI